MTSTESPPAATRTPQAERTAATRLRLMEATVDCLVELGWAGTTLLFKVSKLSKAPAEKTLLYQTGVSAPLLAAGSFYLGETLTQVPSPVALSGVRFALRISQSSS